MKIILGDVKSSILTAVVLLVMGWLVVDRILDKAILGEWREAADSGQQVGETVQSYTEFFTTMREGFNVVTGHQFHSRYQEAPDKQFCYLEFGVINGKVLSATHQLAVKVTKAPVIWSGVSDSNLRTVAQASGVSYSALASAKDDCVFL